MLIQIKANIVYKFKIQFNANMKIKNRFIKV